MIFPNNKEEKEAISELHNVGLSETSIELILGMIRNGDAEGAKWFTKIMLAFIESTKKQLENETIH